MRIGRAGAASLLLGLLLASAAAPAAAQQLILKGEFGLKAGTTPPPGIYVGAFGANNLSDQFAGPNGDVVTGPEFNQWIVGGLVEGVTNFKILGGNYGFIVGVPFANLQSDFPRLGVDTSSGMALSQLWVVPVMLGWHFDRADLTFHYAFYPKTGRYEPGDASNTALGMFTNEFSLRGTYFFDAEKKIHAALGVFYDINGQKEGIDYTQGDPLTLMGGVGVDYGAKGSKTSGWAGLVGYAQWQLTNTTGQDVLPPVANNKSQIYAVGPELTTLEGGLTVRYLWQFGGEYSTVGSTLYAQLVMPVKMF